MFKYTKNETKFSLFRTEFSAKTRKLWSKTTYFPICCYIAYKKGNKRSLRHFYPHTNNWVLNFKDIFLNYYNDL